MTEEEKKVDGQTAEPAAQKKKKKWPIVVGVVVAVLVVAGAGFWVWHEQPSFCNAICHSPMDKYVETYSEGDPGKLVTQHAAAGDDVGQERIEHLVRQPRRRTVGIGRRRRGCRSPCRTGRRRCTRSGGRRRPVPPKP